MLFFAQTTKYVLLKGKTVVSLTCELNICSITFHIVMMISTLLLCGLCLKYMLCRGLQSVVSRIYFSLIGVDATSCLTLKVLRSFALFTFLQAFNQLPQRSFTNQMILNLLCLLSFDRHQILEDCIVLFPFPLQFEWA